MQTVAVIGAGLKGRAFAMACARAGYRVILEDVMPSKLRDALVEFPGQEGVMEFASTVEDAVREADFAIDFVPDELESKLELVCMIDRMAPPRTVVMVQTTALSVSDLAACTYRAEKCVGVRLGDGEVSLVRGLKTAEASANEVAGLFAALGCTTVYLEDRVVVM
jgi:3-hydroxybutyryl-CoA dehydrogenase